MSRLYRRAYLETAASQYVCLAIGVATGVLAARWLGPGGRGELAALSYASVLMVSFGHLGVPQALSFLAARFPSRRGALGRAGFQLAVVVSVAASVVMILVVPFLLRDQPALQRGAMLVAVASVPVLVNVHLLALARGSGLFGRVNRLMVLNALGYLLALCLLWGLGLLTPLAAALAACAVHAAVVLTQLLRAQPGLVGSAPRSLRRLVLRYGRRLLKPTIAIAVFWSLDRALLLSTTTLEQIGYYAVAMTLAHPLTLSAEAFSQVGFVELAAEPDGVRAREMLGRRLRLAILLAALLTVVALPLAPLALELAFGVAFTPAAPAALLLIPAMSLRGLSKYLDNALRALRLETAGVWAGGAGAVLLTTTGLAWGAARGASGFAATLLLAEAVCLGVLVAFALARAGVTVRAIWPFDRRTLVDLRDQVQSIVAGMRGRAE